MPAFRNGAFAIGLVAMFVTATAFAEDPPKTQIEAPAEPNAIPLNTGSLYVRTMAQPR